jgi:multicomponent Na+:H+ antiporter subunit E
MGVAKGSGMRTLSLFVVLLVFWLALSGKYDLRHSTDRYLTACGVASCLFVTWLSRRHGLLDEEGHPVHLAVRLPFYFLWLLWEIVVSNYDVIKRIWSPRMPISPRVVSVPFQTKTDLGAVIYANSVTLTPGTVTIGVDPVKGEMLVHCLTKEAEEDLRAGGMLRKVRKLEGGE